MTEWDWSSEKLFQSRYTVYLNTKEPIKSSLTTFSAPKILKLSEAVYFLSMRIHTQLFTAAVPTTLASTKCRRWIKEWKEERCLKQIPLLHRESQGESLWIYHILSRILLQLLWGWLAMGGVHIGGRLFPYLSWCHSISSYYDEKEQMAVWLDGMRAWVNLGHMTQPPTGLLGRATLRTISPEPGWLLITTEHLNHDRLSQTLLCY